MKHSEMIAGKKYRLKHNGGMTVVTAVRAGDDGPCGINTWWTKPDGGEESQTSLDKLSPLTHEVGDRGRGPDEEER